MAAGSTFGLGRRDDGSVYRARNPCSHFNIWSMLMQGAAECIVVCLPSSTTGDQKRHRPPVALVGSAVGRPQPVLLMHRTQDNVEGHEHNEDGTVRRHARQEQEESQSTEVAGMAAEAERPRPHHLVVGAARRSLRLRCGTNITACEEVPQWH